MRALSLLLLLLLCGPPCSVAADGEFLPDTLHADTLPPDTSRRIDPVRLGIVGGATVGGFIVGHGLLGNLWWKGERSSFHFDIEHDWRYALGSDKLGHAWFPYFTATVYNGILLWCGLDSTASMWWSSGLALGYQTYIEIRDGFSAEWGFAPGDMAANIVGAGLPIARHYLPSLRAFQFKISFAPSERFRSGSNAAIIDDYESTLHWIGLDVESLLPPSMASWWPDWLGLAVGHTVRGLDGQGGGEHEFYLSFDINVERLPGDTGFLRYLKRVVNLYHLPMPAVRIAPEVIWFGLKL